MKKSLWFIVLLGLIFAVLLFTGTAFADDPMKVSLELSKNKFSEPEMITVSISVTNIGDYDMPGPVKLYYPSGRQVEEFGAPKCHWGRIFCLVVSD